MDSTRTRAFLALLLTMVFWGSAAVFMRTLALALTPENSLAMRYVFVSLINVVGLAYLGTWRVRRADWPRFLFAGLVGMAGYNWFVNAGFALVPAGLGTIITMVEPLMIALLAAALLGEKLNRFTFIGIALAMLGAVVLFWQDLTATATSQVPAIGVVYLMLCCLCWAIYTIVSKPLLDRYDSFTVTAITMLVAAPPLIWSANQPLLDLAQALNLRQWAELIYLVLASGVGGVLLWNYGSKHLSSTIAGTFLYLLPVVAVAGGALVLSEPVTIFIVLGGMLMLAGVAAAQFGPARFARR
jgi:drug/metabolite transporter (DMT)-like permease